MPGRRTAPAVDCGGLAPWQLRLAVRLLIDDACGDLSIAHVATRCGLSRSYFERAFKASVGTPPHRWAVRQRVRRAVEMLERTEDSVCQIASSCGFADQSHLTRVFGAVVGTSPAAWRRRRRAGLVPSVPLTARPSAAQLWRDGRPAPEWTASLGNPLFGIHLPASRDPDWLDSREGAGVRAVR